MKQTLFLLKNHFTNDSRVLNEGLSLTKAGYRVTIRCLWDEGLPREEVVDGIHVERICESSRKVTKSIIKKVFMSFVFGYHVQKDLKKFSFIHCHDLVTLPFGVVAKWIGLNKHKIIYDSHEYQTEQQSKPKWLRPILKVVEKFCLKFAEMLISGPWLTDKFYFAIRSLNLSYGVFPCKPACGRWRL